MGSICSSGATLHEVFLKDCVPRISILGRPVWARGRESEGDKENVSHDLITFRKGWEKSCRERVCVLISTFVSEILFKKVQK